MQKQRCKQLILFWHGDWPPAPRCLSSGHSGPQTSAGCGSVEGWPESAYQSWREKEGEQTRGGDERNPQVESSLDSIAFAAFLSLFVQSWKCDILKLVFIETNVRRGESSQYL